MKRLPKNFTKYGEQFEQICRTESTAIYLRHVNGRQRSYEVIIIRVGDRKADKSAGKLRFVGCEPYESYPTSEKWGLTGWTYTTEERARAKYDLLNQLETALSLPSKRLRTADGILKKRILLASYLPKQQEDALCEKP